MSENWGSGDWRDELIASELEYTERGNTSMLVPSRSLTGVPPSSVPVAWETLLLRGGIGMGLVGLGWRDGKDGKR